MMTNGNTTTTDQWTWRTDLLWGASPYAVINVTATSKESLFNKINKLRAMPLMQGLLNH